MTSPNLSKASGPHYSGLIMAFVIGAIGAYAAALWFTPKPTYKDAYKQGVVQGACYTQALNEGIQYGGYKCEITTEDDDLKPVEVILTRVK